MKKSDIIEYRKKLKNVDYCSIVLRIEMPDSSTETVISHKVDSKISFICNAYDDDLVNKNNKQIKIVGCTIYGDLLPITFSQMLEIFKYDKYSKYTREGWENGEYIYFKFDNENKYIMKKEKDENEKLYVPSQEDLLAADWMNYNQANSLKTHG